MLNESVRNNSLREAIAGYMIGDGPDEFSFYRALVGACLLSPVVLRAPGGTGGDEFDLVNLSDEEGQLFLPAFTDREELLRFAPADTPDTMTLRFGDYRHLFQCPDSSHVGLVINPGSESFIIDRVLMLRIDEVLPTLGVALNGPYNIPVRLAPEWDEEKI